jgi:hypothetical protein
LDMNKEFDLQTTEEQIGDKVITKVEWVNDPEFSKFNRKVDAKKIGGAKLGKALQGLNAEFGPAKLKNYAPSAGQELGFDDTEEVPF